ncbi:MAG: hypothetical protein FD129_2698, partial [bacterium]
GNLVAHNSPAPPVAGSSVHPTLFPPGSGSIRTNASVSAIALPPVDFSEACLLPRVYAHCPAAGAARNENAGHVTGYFDPAALSTNQVLTSKTGSAPSVACDGGANRKTICLDAGFTYYFRGIDIAATTDLALRGTSTYKTIVYLDSPACTTIFRILGQTRLGTSGSAANLLFYAGSSNLSLPGDCVTGPALLLAGAGSFAGDLYAPAFELTIGGLGGPDNGDFFGRIRAKSVQIAGNQSLHFDEALGVANPAGCSSAKRTVLLVE